ncbi:MAG: hybrid sensor histidine kinase/response regulator, partial [Gemmatimonadetes bacterium]
MTAEDVAAQLARERALKQAEKMEMVGRLTGAIAQQFNELLTTILARTAALAPSLSSNRDLDALRDTAQRGAELAQRLLGFSRHRTLDLQPL